jgi:hypothetical protein
LRIATILRLKKALFQLRQRAAFSKAFLASKERETNHSFLQTHRWKTEVPVSVSTGLLTQRAIENLQRLQNNHGSAGRRMPHAVDGAIDYP